MLTAAQLVPDGLLVFTPSYSLLDMLAIAWQVRWYSVSSAKGGGGGGAQAELAFTPAAASWPHWPQDPLVSLIWVRHQRQCRVTSSC